MSDELAEAERWLLQYFDGGDEFTRMAGLVMAEYDRRGLHVQDLVLILRRKNEEITRLRAVEKAAAAYVNPPANDPVWKSDRYAELEALIRAGEQP